MVLEIVLELGFRQKYNDKYLVGLELPQGDIDGDTTLTLGLEFVQNPGVLEGTLAHLLGLLLELLDGTLVDTAAFVDQVTSGSGFTRVDVTDDDNVNMSFFLTHVFSIYLYPEVRMLDPG